MPDCSVHLPAATSECELPEPAFLEVAVSHSYEVHTGLDSRRLAAGHTAHCQGSVLHTVGLEKVLQLGTFLQLTMLLGRRLTECCVASVGQLGSLICFQHAVSRRLHTCREAAPELRPPTSYAPCTPASTRSSPLPTSPQRRGLLSSASMRMPWATAMGTIRSEALQLLLLHSAACTRQQEMQCGAFVVQH